MITQDEYNVVKQTDRHLFARINLLNYKYQIVDELKGTLVGDPTFTINAESDVRRTCSFSLVPTDSSFDIKYGNKVWMDKYIQIYIGIKNNKTKDITYSNMGLYMVHNPNHVYSSINNTITIQGLDLMAKLNGLRNGNLEGITYKIPEGTKIRDAVITTLKEAGIEKYIIDDLQEVTPYEIKIETQSTIYNILVSLREIYPNYQMYFDVDGVFHFEKIPSGKNEQIFIDDDIWNRTLIDYSKSTNYSSVKNYIEVFGKTHDVKNFGKAKLVPNYNIYVVKIPTITKLRDYLKIGFVTNFSSNKAMLRVNENTVFPILNEDGTSVDLEANTYYVVKFREYPNSTEENLKGYFYFMGELQPHAIAKDDNVNSPFYINGSLGIVRQVLRGGEYDNIYTSNLAQQRADWELYRRCRLQDTITLNCLPIYWADVNKIISITLPNKQTGDEEKKLYIIKSINTTFGVNGIQSMQCIKYYPFYNE